MAEQRERKSRDVEQKTRRGTGKWLWVLVGLVLTGLMLTGTAIVVMIGVLTSRKRAVKQVATPIPTMESIKVVAKVSPKDGMVMVYVPAGEFRMGSDIYDDEKPEHRVYLDGYWIDKTEVTNRMFRKFVKENGYQPEGIWWRAASDENIEGEDKHPVVNVSWNDAVAYCQWAGRRLPTEAEWEKAARGTDGRKYPWGNEAPKWGLANIWDRGADGYEYTAPVGSYPEGASPYGVLDMAGNVWEWVADWYDENYYDKSPAKNPAGPTTGELRVVRGGSWLSCVWDIRSADRYWFNPSSYRHNGGFRCSRSP